MPYSSVNGATQAGFPTKAEGIDLSLAQINKLASIYDAVKANGSVDNPMAVAWTQWKKIYIKKGNAWVKRQEMKIEKYNCECLKCGYKMESEEHCKNIECPECGGEMRRTERPGIGNLKIEDEIELEEFQAFTPPEAGDLSDKGKKILASAYSSYREQWVKDHPDDKENKTNKERCAKIAWAAVKNAGLMKNNDKIEFKLETVDIDKPLNVLQTGKVKNINITEETLDKMIENFNNKVAEPYSILSKDTQLTINHDPKFTNMLKEFFKVASLGYVKELFRKGRNLFAKFKRVPKLIAELIDAGSLKQRSSEFIMNYKHANGKEYGPVLCGVTFHGADGFPAISSLEDIPKLFKSVDEIPDEYLIKSIELKDEGDRISVPCFFKEENSMEMIEIKKDEYQELIAFKNESEKLKKENEFVQQEAVKLKEENEDLKQQLEKNEVELKSFEQLKTQVAEDKKSMIEKEATDFIDGIINDKKMLPKFRDQKINEYIRYKNEDNEDIFNLFKEEIESRDVILDFSNKLGKEENTPLMKINWETGEGLDEAIKLKQKEDPKLSYEQARDLIEQEYDEKEVI